MPFDKPEMAPRTIVRPVTAHGWLRRSDQDSPGGHAWELPDGTMKMLPKDQPAVLVTLLPKPKE